MTSPPKIEGAVGLVWRARKDGWVAFWVARPDLVKRGWTIKTRWLWGGAWPSEIECSWIYDQCQALQAEMLVWGRGGLPSIGPYDGTIRGLIACYRSDPDSGYRKLRYQTRKNYDALLRVIEREEIRLADIKGRTVLRWHDGWAAGGKVAMAHGVVGMLRTLLSFGSAFLEDADCTRMSAVLHKMRFSMARPRDERLTAEQAAAVQAKAHEMGLHSVALAQAIQFECMLRQKDVIGEWVPLDEPGTSEVTHGRAKWLRGLRWNEIDANLILRHTTSKRLKDIEIDLKLAPMVLEELQRLGPGPFSGPVIVSERTGRPYITPTFRRTWRAVADAAGIPKTVRNMDSRAGAISEATDAGAELEHVRHAATHSDIAMTQRYSRAGAEKTARVMQLRAKFRGGNEGGK